MDLGELHVFLTVAKEGSFSRAAERLYRTQPAISLGIRKLEDSLGQPLFVRGSRPVRLTDAGVLLKEYAERLLNLRDEVKKGLSELEGLNDNIGIPISYNLASVSTDNIAPQDAEIIRATRNFTPFRIASSSLRPTRASGGSV